MDDAVIHRRIIIVTQEHDVQQVGLVSTVELPEYYASLVGMLTSGAYMWTCA